MKIHFLMILLITALLVVGCAQEVVEDTQEAPDQEPAPVVEPEEEVSVPYDEPAGFDSGIEILGKEGFLPAETMVGVGDVVFKNSADKASVLTFKNMDTNKASNSPLIKPGEEYVHTFQEPGTYTYWGLTFGVEGTLIVK